MKVGVQVEEELVEGVELEDIATTVVGGGSTGDELEDNATTEVGGGSTGATGGRIKSSSDKELLKDEVLPEEDELEDATTGVGGRLAEATSGVEFSSDTEERRDVEDNFGETNMVEVETDEKSVEDEIARVFFLIVSCSAARDL